MSELHAQLALFGLIDEIVTTTGDPKIAATVEKFLPRTTGPGQRGWYAELTNFLSKDELFPRDDDGNVRPRSGAVQVPDYVGALTELRSGVQPELELPPDTPRPSPAVLSKTIFASMILAKIARLLPQLPTHGFDPLTTADPLDALLPMAVSPSNFPPIATPFPSIETPQPPPGGPPPLGAPPPPPPGPPPPAGPQSLRDRLLSVADRTAYTQQLFAGGFGDQLDVAVALNPLPCTGALRRVDGRFCTVLTTDWPQPFITLDGMKAIIDPQNWPELCGFFVRMTPRPALNPDTSRGWSRVLETVSADETQWELRTALRYWKGVIAPNGDIYINYDLDNPRDGDDGLVEVDSGYIWISPLVPGDPSKGVRIRTSKAVRIRGLSATATAALGCIMGWSDAASQMLVRPGEPPPVGAVSFGTPSTEIPLPAAATDATGTSTAGTARASNANVLADAEKVELPDKWRGAFIGNMQKEAKATIETLAPLAVDLLTRWSDGMSRDDVKEFGERSGRALTDRAVAMLDAAAGAVRPPSTTKADGENNQ
jgi:hypothetical protein